MAGTPADTIRAAAKAYLAGDVGGLSEQLHDQVHVLGSEQLEDWADRSTAFAGGLRAEVERLQRDDVESPHGDLVDHALGLDKSPDQVPEADGVAWWSGTGNLWLDGSYHHQTSWTTVLRLEDEDWKIVHSHFSIHR